MTQDLIANMLGVRREGVTEAAGNLQKTASIAYYLAASRYLITPRPRSPVLRMLCRGQESVRSQ
jgi:hypothetical protein